MEAPQEPSSVITKLPKELGYVLFEHLDDTTATCLGLTCKDLYKIFKNSLPALVKLDSFTIDPTTSNPVYLHDLLTAWMGPTYRWPVWIELWVIPIPEYGRFLNKDVYGEELGREERLLAGRWHDYHHSLVCKISHRYGPVLQGQAGQQTSPVLPCQKRLPSPVGLGKKWYLEAKKAIEADDTWRHDWPAWFWCWEGTMVFSSEACIIAVGISYVQEVLSRATRSLRSMANGSIILLFALASARMLMRILLMVLGALLTLVMLPIGFGLFLKLVWHTGVCDAEKLLDVFIQQERERYFHAVLKTENEGRNR